MCQILKAFWVYISSRPVENEPLSGQKSVDIHVVSLFELNSILTTK